MPYDTYSAKESFLSLQGNSDWWNTSTAKSRLCSTQENPKEFKADPKLFEST